MLYLLCIRDDGTVSIHDFDSCAERAEFFDQVDRNAIPTCIEVNGSYQIHV